MILTTSPAEVFLYPSSPKWLDILVVAGEVAAPVSPVASPMGDFDYEHRWPLWELKNPVYIFTYIHYTQY